MRWICRSVSLVLRRVTDTIAVFPKKTTANALSPIENTRMSDESSEDHGRNRKGEPPNMGFGASETQRLDLPDVQDSE